MDLQQGSAEVLASLEGGFSVFEYAANPDSRVPPRGVPYDRSG